MVDELPKMIITERKVTCSCGFEVDLIEDKNPKETITRHADTEHDNKVLVFGVIEGLTG